MVVIVALGVALVATPLAAALARRIGLVDRPGDLKRQSAPVPYLGGLAIFAATGAAVSTAWPRYLVPMAIALALGIADDARALHPRSRLYCEIAIGVAVAIVVHGATTSVLRVVATVVVVVVLVNAVNLMDGLDGLAAGTALASAVALGAVLDGPERTLAWSLAASLVGFLAYNRPPASIYLGDGGAYLLGVTLALLVSTTVRSGEPPALVWGALLMVALPVWDTTVAIIRRRLARQPLFQGDRGHAYDQLVDRGWSPSNVALACFAGQVALAALGVGASRLPVLGSVAVGTGVATALLAVAALGGFLTPGRRP